MLLGTEKGSAIIFRKAIRPKVFRKWAKKALGLVQERSFILHR